MAEKANLLSRNPNVCASCSSLSDGLEEPGPTSPTVPAVEHPAIPEPLENVRALPEITAYRLD
jgi:hypothetical protein